MVAARAGLSEFPIGDRVEADAFWVAFDPDKQSGPRCIEVLFFVAPGTGSTCGSVLNLPAAGAVAEVVESGDGVVSGLFNEP